VAAAARREGGGDFDGRGDQEVAAWSTPGRGGAAGTWRMICEDSAPSPAEERARDGGHVACAAGFGQNIVSEETRFTVEKIERAGDEGSHGGATSESDGRGSSWSCRARLAHRPHRLARVNESGARRPPLVLLGCRSD
jgi:hypothetical protein